MTAMNELSLVELDALRRRGELDTRQLLEDCLARIAAREEEVQAFSWVDPDHARASLAQAGPSRFGKGLEGIPFGVKDIMDTHDMPTGWGSPLYTDSVPPRDAGCVAVLRACGALALGKTVTTEFAFICPGKTRNPHNPAHTPGGSSQGSAAAVADFMLPFALGTQTAASVIRPAAFCGVVGYKASRGAFDLGGVCSLSASMDSLGFFSRDAGDMAVIRAAMLGDAEPVAAQKPASIGLVRTPHWQEADEDTRRVVDQVVRQVEAAGVPVDTVEVGPSDGGLTEAQKLVMAYEVARSRSFEYERYPERISPHIRTLIEEGRGIDPNHYRQALALATHWRGQLAAQLSQGRLLLAPSAPGEAPHGLDSTGDPLFSRMWNLLGVPSMTLPAGRGAHGLPIGVQLVGACDGDDALVAGARWLQPRLDWNGR